MKCVAPFNKRVNRYTVLVSSLYLFSVLLIERILFFTGKVTVIAVSMCW